ncbi:MAG: phosphopyruvate hydratase [Lachnobacterium sp.]|nr:phosphopyruvate hydratase [Lachnobacterium sp.]MCI7086588.1 phosphopyruvate hydratase [Lachnobacterium sp.]MCI7531532.1 phosphopyruvate hydratase [Lachnobacterium sp.]MDD7713441.1 phosphopyruvate hydratase [Lachnobacterium sp.]MDY5461091.1 phosphopyruvate hydratase [Agathobacter sp.]
MSLKVIILEVHGRQILDSRGNPTVEVEVTAQREDNGIKYTGRESVPSGASTGRFEAIELRDGVEEYFGLGVRKVVEHINNRIQQELIGMNVLEQVQIDRKLVELDGTDNKGNLGANALLGVSLACARCAANAMNEPLYRYLGGTNAKRWPMPTMNVINGGAHAKNTLDFQEFMIVPVGADSFPQALRMGAEVYHFLRQILHEDGLSTAIGDEGGFAPDFADAKEVFSYLSRAVQKAGYEVGRDIAFAMDAAASELYSEEDGMYHFPGEKVMRSGQEMIALYEELIQEYPLISIEDGLDENDWDGWQEMTKRLGSEILLVGDDLFVTNVKRIHCGLDLGVANAVLIKVNQIGTLTEAMDAIELAQKSGYKAVISHRSGETEDAFIADLAVAVNAGWIKTGAPCRGERTAKYNQLLRIAEEIDLIQI